MTTTNKNLISTLKLAGLNETESKVYLACLELGPASAWNIYLKTGMKRPTCYAILESLVGDGIASKSFDGQRSIFSVIKPADLLLKIDSKRNQFKESLSMFEVISSRSSEKPQVRIFEGVEGLRQAYMLGLNQPEGSEILIFGSARFWLENEGANRAYIEERIDKKIGIKVIFADNDINRQMRKDTEKELREIKFIDSKAFNPVTETQIFGDIVVYIAHSENEPFATVIESTAVARDERERFKLLWSLVNQ